MFVTSEPNAPIRLYQGDLTLQLGGRTYRGTGSVQLSWLPSPRIRFTLTGTARGVHLPPSLQDGRLSLSSPSRSVRVMATGSSGRLAVAASKTGSPFEIRGVLAETLSWRVSPERIASSFFHIVNLQQVVGGHIDGSESLTGRSTMRMRFAGGPWRFTIDEVPKAHELREALRDEGGYAITHVGRLERMDGRVFSRKDASDALAALFYALSFAQGAWTGPALVTHMSRGRRPVREDWDVPKFDSRTSRQTWFDSTLGRALGPILSGILRNWATPELRRDLEVALSLFVEANQHPSPEGSLLLSQGGLELIAWVSLVEVHGLYGRGRFDGMAAGQRIEALLDWNRMSKGIPTLTWNLRRFANRHGITGGAWAITGLRNGIAHPRQRERTFSTSVLERWDAMQVSLRYLELSLLHFLDYPGDHVNRLKRGGYVGQVTKVPWA